jgi:hypothetical protein
LEGWERIYCLYELCFIEYRKIMKCWKNNMERLKELLAVLAKDETEKVDRENNTTENNVMEGSEL